ncbi:MAG: YpdA family putative bacillithiol disulfide reductase [Gemmatimonadota bacterium]
MDSSSTSADLIVVGAGPCGLAVGAAARKRGLHPILLEAGAVVNSLVGYPPYMEFFSTSERLELENVPFPTPREKPSRQEAMAYYRGIVRHFGLDVRTYHKVVGVHRQDRSEGSSPGGFRVEVKGPHETPLHFSTPSVVVATGGFHEPNPLGVPGDHLPKVLHYWSEAHPYWDQDVAVVGGGNSAVDAALQLFRVGARVTLIHFQNELDRGVKPWVLPDIRNRLEKGEIQVRWGHRVKAVHPHSVQIEPVEGGEVEELVNQWLFAMTGWRGDRTLLESLDVPFHPETGIPAHDPETMETPVPGLYIAGVLAAGDDANKIFIENGRLHGGQIVQDILRRQGEGSTPHR